MTYAYTNRPHRIRAVWNCLMKRFRHKPMSVPPPRMTFGRLEEMEHRVTPTVSVYTDATLGTLVAQYNGVTALNDAVDNVTTLDGYVIVADTTGTDTYNSPGSIPKSLTLLGPNAKINPNTGTRVPEVFINTTNAAGGALTISANKTLTVSGFSFTTPTGRGAFQAFTAGYSLTFTNNIAQNQIGSTGAVVIAAGDGLGGGYTSLVVSDNKITGTDPTRQGIRADTGTNATITGNVVTNGLVGIAVYSSDGKTVTNALVQNNYVADTVREGILVGTGTSVVTVNGNTITNANTSNTAFKGAITIGDNLGWPVAAPTITGNLITASNNGIAFRRDIDAAGDPPFPIGDTVIRGNAIDVNAGTRAVITGEPFDGVTPPQDVVDLSGNWTGTAVAADLPDTVGGTRAFVFESYLSANANANPNALSPSSGQWGYVPLVPNVEMLVPQTAATSGLVGVDGVVQTGVNLAAAGMIVRVADDDYAQSLTVTKSLDLRGAAAGSTTLTGILTINGTGVESVSLTDIGFTGAGSTADDLVELTLANTGPGDSTYTRTDGTIARTGDQPITAIALTNVDALTLSGGSGSDTLAYTGSTAGVTVTLTADGAGFGTGVGSFTGFEALTGSDNADTFVFNGGSISGTLTGGGGSDTLDYSTRTSSVTVTLLSNGNGTATGVGGLVGVENAIGGSAADTFNVAPLSSGAARSIAGNDPTTLPGDVLNFDATGLTGVMLNPTGTGAGNITSNKGTVNFTGIEQVNGIQQAPVFTSPNATTFAAGSFGTFTVSASGAPAPVVTLISGALPAGVTFDPATGILSGIPAAGTGGVYSLQFRATNGVAPDAVQAFTLTVTETSTFTLGTVSNPNGTVDQSGFNATIAIVGGVGPYTLVSATGLPPGLIATIEGAVVRISGTPTQAGIFSSVVITVQDSTGATSTGTYTLTIAPVSRTPVDQNAVSMFAGSPGQNWTGEVRVYNANSQLAYTVTPFSDGNVTGLTVVMADVTGDGVPDVIAGSGVGVRSRVVVIDGVSREIVRVWLPFEDTFTGGVFVAAADVTGDGRADVAVSAGTGGGTRVIVFDGANEGVLADFFGIDDPSFRGGARVAFGDVNGDGIADLGVSAGLGGGPRVALFDGLTLRPGSTPTRLTNDIFILSETLRDGVFLTLGDINGDGFADVIAGGGPNGGGAQVLGLDGLSLISSNGVDQVTVADFVVGGSPLATSARVAAKDLDGDDRSDLVVAVTAEPGGIAFVYSGASIPASGTPGEAVTIDVFPGSPAGIFVG